MINEVIEVQEYLNGNHIVKNNLYRVCCLLSKWYKEQGLNQLQIRKSIFTWANENNIYIKYNLNNIISNVLADKTRLRDNVIVKISDEDINEIVSRFDSRKTRISALAMLCYAKAYANRDNEFYISSIPLGAWLSISDSNMRFRYIKELIDFEYISKIEVPKNNFKWNNKENRSSKYRMNVPIHNNGKYVLIDNNIEKLFDEIFIDYT